MRAPLSAALTVAALTCGATPSQATAFCLVRQTTDGFAALRAAPRLDAKVLARMRAGEEVQLTPGHTGRWRQVIYWRGEDRLTKGYAAQAAKGWVDGRLIEDCG